MTDIIGAAPYRLTSTGKLDSAALSDGNPDVILLGRGNFTDGSNTPASIYAGTSWAMGSNGGGSNSVVSGALQMNYPSMIAGSSGGIFNSLHFDPQIGLNELYIKFDAKMPNVKHGCKFCKIFGYQNGGNYANTTFALDYTGGDNGAMRYIAFGDGTTTANDTAQALHLNGANPSWIGRSYGAGASVTHGGQFFDSADWGTGWHTFRLHIKFNSGTTALNEVNDGEISVNIDGVDYVRATGIFNRHYSNGSIKYIAFGDHTQSPAASPVSAFDINYDNIFISRHGFYEGV